MSEPVRPTAARPSWFRQVTFHSLLAGLCPIIPVPFLDDRVLAGVRRKMVRDLAAELWEQQGYLEALEARFRERLALAGQTDAGPEPTGPPPSPPPLLDSAPR